VSVACNGSMVMLGRKNGVFKLLQDEFLCYLWHCACHRLELSITGTLKALEGINTSSAFMDKLCHLLVITVEEQVITVIAKTSESQLLKIGRTLSSWWVA
jgi:hypothetical protein